MLATLGFAALPRVPADMAPTFQALHEWLDGWRGIGDIEAGMSRQGYDLRAGAFAHLENRHRVGKDRSPSPPPRGRSTG